MMTDATETASRYGADAAEWLRRWDENRTVWSIEMGGMGPGYEQAIQMSAAELLRIMIDDQMDHSKWRTDNDAWSAARKTIGTRFDLLPIARTLGLSGAQFGAALQLAARLYIDGPFAAMSDPEVADRHIQVCRVFPGAAA